MAAAGTTRRLKLGVLALTLLGGAVAVWLVLRGGLGPVLAALRSVGWVGFGVVCAWQLGLTALLAAAWQVVAPGAPLRRFGDFCWARLARDAAAEVLPLAPVGAMVVGSRALVLRGWPVALALGSLMAAVTAEMAAQVVYALASIGLLVQRLSASGPGAAPGSSHVAGLHLVAPLLAGSAVGAATVAGFYLAQRRGLGVAQAVAGRWLPKAAGQAAAVSEVVAAIYARPVRMAASFVAHLLAWAVTAGASWVALGFIGARLGFVQVFALEGLLYALRSAAFFVPGALGVQEAGYTLMGPLFGLSVEAGLALSLLRRARDIALGVPVVLIWQALESRAGLSAPVLSARPSTETGAGREGAGQGARRP